MAFHFIGPSSVILCTISLNFLKLLLNYLKNIFADVLVYVMVSFKQSGQMSLACKRSWNAQRNFFTRCNVSHYKLLV